MSQFFFKSESRCIARKDNVIGSALPDLFPKGRQHPVRIAKAVFASKPLQVEPAGKTLVEPVGPLPAKTLRRDVDIAEMRQANGCG